MCVMNPSSSASLPIIFGAVCLVTLLSPSATAQLTITPTTTLSAETANNTSTSSTFNAQTNGNAGPGNVSKISIRSLLYPGSTGRIYAAVMPWFGRPDHMSVGYTSSDPAKIADQVSDMLSRGIQGAVIPWYGASSLIQSDMAINFMQEAQSRGNFEFAIMIDVGALVAYAQQNGCDVTSQLITDLNYIASTFYASSAYSKVNGRPVMYFFGVEAYYIDWSKVRSNIAGNPMFLIRNQDAFSDSQADGAYSWVEINRSNPNDMMLSYLDSFYTAAQSSSKYTEGSGYKGFNDTLASWGANRVINQQCAATWLDTFAETNKYYSSSHQLAAAQIVTWNDYEEGTEIESGVDNCVALGTTVTGSTLSWTIGAGNETAVDHYRVFISTDGQNLMKLADVPAGTHSLALSQYSLAAGLYVLYVKAVGKASVVNHMSRPIGFNPADQAPIASLSLSATSGPAPLTITASSASSSDPDGSITLVKIDFGDGTVNSGGAGFSASHTYSSRGTYTVTLTVTDNAGVFSSTQRAVNVAAGPGVTITSPGAGATLNSPVHVSATAIISGGVSYMEVLVDFVTPPAYVATGSSVNTYLPITAGTHTIRVVAHDTTAAANYIYSDVTFTVGANDAPPTARLTVTPFGGTQVMACTATSYDSDGSISSSLVNFGDGATAGGPTAFHTYGSPGTYTVSATVTDNQGVSSSTSTQVTVGSTTTTGTLAGRVTSITDGYVIAGAKLALGSTSTTADSNGYYSFKDLPAGAYVLTASAAGFLSRSFKVSVVAGTTTTQNVQLAVAGVLQGTVTNTSGTAIGGALVTISGGVMSSTFSATTNSSGGYNFGWIPVGNYAVTVTASGYTSSTVTTTINTGQTTTLTVRLSTGSTGTGSINGRVTSAVDGHALAGATVSTGSASTTTDSNGNYSFGSLAAATYTLTASSPGWLSAKASVTVISGGSLTQNFQLSTSGVLQGKVTNSSGTGISGAKITFTGGVFSTTNSVTADSSGNYYAGWIPVGNYVVSAIVSGVAKSTSITISAGVVTNVNFTF